MQKIMFNDKYGLTEAVLQGRKTMTRREISKHFPTEGVELIGITGIGAEFRIGDNYEPVFVRLPYKVGEVVAIAQSYKDCGYDGDTKYGWCYDENEERTDVLYKDVPGWKNKMFVRSSRMPHRIRITDLKVERLQDISDEDCLKEGVKHIDLSWCKGYEVEGLFNKGRRQSFWYTPHEDFAALIDKVSGRGTWDKNPWVFAYTFDVLQVK